MHLDGYYSSGQFARLANVTVRTIRFYDKHNILKPSYINANGARFYTDSDLARLQQILLLKYLGFSLDEIREITIDDSSRSFLLNSLSLQQKLVQDRIEQMQLVLRAINETTGALEQGQVDWEKMLNLIHLTSMENSLATQYKDANNLSARIRLHTLYSTNKQGWFPWVFEQCQLADGMRVLEVGCGSGSLWRENMERIPAHAQIVLSDISGGMLRDVRRSLQDPQRRFSFATFSAEHIPYEDNAFDLVIANHVLFYCTDINKALSEMQRVLAPGGMLIASTYGAAHMAEITRLVQEFDVRIVLSADHLYDRFGLENGKDILAKYFTAIEERNYADGLDVDKPEPLIEYILSCHGNQNQYLLDRYQEFRQFVAQKVEGSFHITKQAGLFLCKK